MRGLIHRADIYRRVGSGISTLWEATPFIVGYQLRIDALSPQAVLREKYASCSHLGVGTYDTDITQGMKLVIMSGPFYTGMELHIAGVDAALGSSAGRSHLEMMLTETKSSVP